MTKKEKLVGRRQVDLRFQKWLHNEDYQDVPFLLEDRIKSLGGKYEKADKWGVRIDFCSFSGALLT
jgi:hypothetical protein